MMTLPTVLGTTGRESARRLSGLPIVVAPLILFVVLTVVTAVRADSWFAKEYPAGPASVVERIASREPQARIYADLRFADWLLWRNPALAGRVAFDARLELLTKHELRTIWEFQARRGDDWTDAVRGYRIVVLNESRDDPITRSLLQRPGSDLAYSGPGGTVVTLAT
jgi:hypothetical protein